jgi:ABC-2 type transport system permease protein
LNTQNLLTRFVWPVLLTAEMTLRQNAANLFVIFTIVIQPLIVAMLALWMLGAKVGEGAIFIVVGSGMTGLWSGLLYLGGNSITFERWMGTLEQIAGVPTPLQVIILGKNLALTTQSLLSMIASYTLASLFFGYPLRVEQPILFAISLVLTVVAFVSFGLILSPLFLLNPAVQNFQNGLEFPIYILSGFLFPIALLPGWTTPLSYALPTYWAARALHVTAAGAATPRELALTWGLLIVFTAVYLFLSGRLFKVVLRRVRDDATLGLQ